MIISAKLAYLISLLFKTMILISYSYGNKRKITNWTFKRSASGSALKRFPFNNSNRVLAGHLYGELVPFNTTNTNNNGSDQNIEIHLDNLKRWSFDNGSADRGFLVESNEMLYLLQEPSKEQHEIHERSRAVCGLLCNLLDLFSDEDGDVDEDLVNEYKMKTPEEIYKDLVDVVKTMALEEESFKQVFCEPFDLLLLQNESGFIKTELSNFTGMKNKDPFLKWLTNLSPSKKLEDHFYEQSFEKAEKRSMRHSWGGEKTMNGCAWKNQYHKLNSIYMNSIFSKSSGGEKECEASSGSESEDEHIGKKQPLAHQQAQAKPENTFWYKKNQAHQDQAQEEPGLSHH